MNATHTNTDMHAAREMPAARPFPADHINRLGTAVAWGYFGGGLAFVALALLRLGGAHLGLSTLVRGLTGV